jgi:hypothetical protein
VTITATFALQNVPVNADTVRQAIASLLPNGSNGIVQPGDFTVTQTGTPSMGVSVGVGRAWIEGTDAAHLTGQAYGKQGKYFVLNDAPYTVSIATADNTNPRIDVIYVAVQDAMYAGANNQAVIAVATGTPVAGATYPTNAPTLPNNSMAIAWVNVPANAASITNSNITAATRQALAPMGIGAWQNLTLNSNWSSPGAFGMTAQIRQIHDGFQTRGVIFRTSGTVVLNETVATLPVGWYPTAAQYFIQKGSQSSFYGMQIDPGGFIWVQAVPVGNNGTQNYISLDVIIYY